MQAAFIQETGPPDCIQFGSLPDPEVGPHDVLVQVRAVSVNPIDTYLRGGAGYWEMPMPFIVGCDFAGVVQRTGQSVERFRPGDRVWGSNQGLLGRQGTFSELCAVAEDWVYPLPDAVSYEDAAAAALVGITAHLGLFRDAQLQPGESVFVQGGSGGVGSTVVQMAKAAGARVIASGSSEEKLAACQQAGADAVVNYRTDDIPQRVEAFAPGGVDVFWETCREPNFDAIVSVMAERGRIVLMAGRDARPNFPVGPFYVKGCSLHGFVMFKATPQEQRQCADGINEFLSHGKLKPHVGRRLPLSEAAEAHRLQEANTINQAGSLRGKIVLTPDAPS